MEYFPETGQIDNSNVTVSNHLHWIGSNYLLLTKELFLAATTLKTVLMINHYVNFGILKRVQTTEPLLGHDFSHSYTHGQSVKKKLEIWWMLPTVLFKQ